MYTFDDYLVSDLHKDAYGFRPDQSFWNNWELFNSEQKQQFWDNMLVDLRRTIEGEEAEQQAAIAKFEDLIDNFMHEGTTRKEVVNQLRSDSVFEHNEARDFEFYKNLPLGYLEKMGYV